MLLITKASAKTLYKPHKHRILGPTRPCKLLPEKLQRPSQSNFMHRFNSWRSALEIPGTLRLPYPGFAGDAKKAQRIVKQSIGFNGLHHFKACLRYLILRSYGECGTRTLVLVQILQYGLNVTPPLGIVAFMAGASMRGICGTYAGCYAGSFPTWFSL